MITPRFKLSQDPNCVHFTIRAPYCSFQDLDISVEDEVFVFYCKPYLLRLNLPGKLRYEHVENSFSFDADSGTFQISYKKATPGENFEDLDLITKMLVPKVEVVEAGRKITILGSDGTEIIGQDEDVDKKNQYGFAMLGRFNLENLISDFGDVFEVNPFEVILEERKTMRMQSEQQAFAEEHYLADFFETEEIDEIMKFKNPYSKSAEFTDEERDYLKDLQNIKYSLTDDQRIYCHNSLIDILYAYCYDRRTTEFEGNVESGWNIVKVAASLSWLDGFKEPQEVLVSSYRRALIYPLHRNFALCEKIFQDLLDILNAGKIQIIKCLINIHHIFLGGDCGRYILNDIFIKHYIRYIMNWGDETLQKILADVSKVQIKKNDLGLSLEEHEENARLSLMMSSAQIDGDDSDSTDSDDTISSEDSDSDSSDDSSDEETDSSEN